MNTLEKKLNEDFLTKILLEILNNSKMDEEWDMINKHIEICINDLEYEYKNKNLMNELINIVETYIQYGKRTIDFYINNEDICKNSNYEFYETKKYLQNIYDPDNKWECIKKDLQNFSYRPTIFYNNISKLKYEIKMNSENMKDEELSRWEEVINLLEILKKDNTEDFIRISEKLVSGKLNNDPYKTEEWEMIKTNLRNSEC